MEITSIFGLCTTASLYFLSCTDGDGIQQNIAPNVDTMPVELALGMAPMYDTGGVTHARGDNSLDSVLGKEAGKAPDYTGAHSATNAGAQVNSATDAGAHPQTRASLTDAQENTVGEIYVFQLENTTNTLRCSGRISLGTGTLTTDISLTAGIGACTVYTLADVGGLTSKVAYRSSLTNFKKLITRVTSGKGTSNNLLMCGSNDNLSSSTANILAVPLTRLVAKVNLNLTLPNGAGSFTVRVIRLMNVAKRLYYVELTAPTTSAELTDYTSDSSDAITWYIPKNKAGTISLTDWKDRYEGNSPTTVTYILVEGDYTPQNGTARDVTYATYLEGNGPADFDVTHDTKYIVNVSIRGTNLDDGRVSVGEDLGAAGIRTANCYVVKTAGANKRYRFKATVRGNGAQTAGGVSYTEAIILAGNKISPVKAGLAWEARDNSGAIHTLDYVDYSCNGYIVFKLGSASEDNVMVAAKDDTSKILWGQHIWVTTAFDGDNIKEQTYETHPRSGISGYENITKRIFKMADHNLGVASAMPASKTEARVIKTHGLIYQFGRKNLFPSAGVMTRADDAELIPSYDTSGVLVTRQLIMANNPKYLTNSQVVSGQGTDAAAISKQLTYVVENPLIYVMSSGTDMSALDGESRSFNWIRIIHKNMLPWKVSNKLWGSDILNESNSNFFITKSVTKTIYDPRPYGYHVPQQDVWTNFLTATNRYSTFAASEFSVVNGGKVVSSDAQDFMHSTFPVFGRRFLTTRNAAMSDESNVAFYPAASGRFNDKTLSYVGSAITCWSASPYDSTSIGGSLLYGNTTGVSLVQGGIGRMVGFPMRCVHGN